MQMSLSAATNWCLPGVTFVNLAQLVLMQATRKCNARMHIAQGSCQITRCHNYYKHFALK